MDRVSDQINNNIECLTLVLVSHMWFYVRIFGNTKLNACYSIPLEYKSFLYSLIQGQYEDFLGFFN